MTGRVVRRPRRRVPMFPGGQIRLSHTAANNTVGEAMRPNLSGLDARPTGAGGGGGSAVERAEIDDEIKKLADEMYVLEKRAKGKKEERHHRAHELLIIAEQQLRMYPHNPDVKEEYRRAGEEYWRQIKNVNGANTPEEYAVDVKFLELNRALIKMKRLTGNQRPAWELQEQAMDGAKARAMHKAM